MKWQRLQRLVFVVFLILVVASIFVYQIWGNNFGLDQIRQYLKGFGIWAPLVFIILYTVGTIFIPSTPFMAIAGVLFGFKYGLFYTIIGGSLSSVLVFFISRKLGKERVDNILNNKYLKPIEKYNKRLESGGVWDLIVLRILPIMPFNALNILMGVSRIKTEDYIIGTLIGLAPSNVLAVYFGNLISKIF